MSKVLVTGGAGFIGSSLVRHFLKKRHEVVIVDNLSTSLKKNLIPGVTLYKTNILSKNLLTIFKKEKPDFVSHHAAQIKVMDSIKDPLNDAKSNILGTINVLECARQVNVKKFIFSSTGGAIYGSTSSLPSDESVTPRPESPYAISKLGCELYITYFAKQYKLPYTIFRYANVYGPGQRGDNEGGVIAIFIHNILIGKPLIMYGNGKQSRDFIYISDIISVNELAMKNKRTGIFNVGTGKATSINDLVHVIKRSIDKNVKVMHLSKRKGEIEKSVLDIHKIKQYMDWQPSVSLSEGIEQMIVNYKNKRR